MNRRQKPRDSQITPEMVVTAKRMRFNPIRSLTPEVLSTQLDSWLVGHLRDFAITADAIFRRDDMIQPVLSKRLKAPGRLKWSINQVEGLQDGQKARAEQHQAALQYLFDNISTTAALDRNQKGGMRLLVRQMMDAVAYRYSVHEIVWVPRIDQVTGQPRLTANLTHVPLWFFENTSSRLRFLPNAYGGLAGNEMSEDEWLVTVADGLMEVLSVCYMFKQMSLKDWVSFNDKFGTPGIHALTDAAKDTAEWRALEDAVADFSQNWEAVTNRGAEFKLIEAKNSGGTNPFQPLIERMDRAIAIICRGADLSTVSAGSGSGQGASLQGEETDLLEADDAQTIAEALDQLSRTAIKQLFGDDVPLAYIQLGVRSRKTTDDTIKKLTFLRDSGVPIGQEYARQELGVPAPADDEEVLRSAPTASPQLNLANAATKPAALARDQAFRANAIERLTAAQRASIAPLVSRLQAVADAPDERFDAELAKLKTELPQLYRTVLSDPAVAAAWEEIYGAALVSGAAEGREQISTDKK
jgi:phage gp29-like protein